MEKTYKNTDFDGVEKNVPDVEKFGDADSWKLLCKAWSKEEDWMKSTKVLPVPGVGVFVQVTTQQGDNIAEAVCFAEGIKLISDPVTRERSLVKMVEGPELVPHPDEDQHGPHPAGE